MSHYSDNPVLDAERHFDALDARAEAAEAESIESAKTMKSDFMHFATRNVTIAAAFSKPYQGYGRLTGAPYLRHSTVSEIMSESLDLGDGPSTDDLMQFLADEANTGNRAALELIERMATKYSEVNA